MVGTAHHGKECTAEPARFRAIRRGKFTGRDEQRAENKAARQSFDHQAH
jgi:hypothetical protein